ncbi:catalase-related domain-containing protein [Cohnella lubricantis]|uniref:Catalase immune-responsive domain-containing protein n=1 Tax=Cohnella lubricantis TaxID=2163172 RepID=A0A841T425_9BACL|nr:catalase-related domain-containing protein [Cohnella lubricantis]MBB6676323.1 hypothetical protein [Cohnella lubricantis]MBP2120308.1 catalase [Cohnella lubricantis]
MNGFTTNQGGEANGFSQAALVYNGGSDEQKAEFVDDLAAGLRSAEEMTKLLAICNYYQADAELGERLADVLQINIKPYLEQLARL